MPKTNNNKPKTPRDASTYRHPEADSPLRPEVGTQPQFKKRKPPVTYRYDSSLSPALEWDGQNHAREAGRGADPRNHGGEVAGECQGALPSVSRR